MREYYWFNHSKCITSAIENPGSNNICLPKIEKRGIKHFIFTWSMGGNNCYRGIEISAPYLFILLGEWNSRQVCTRSAQLESHGRITLLLLKRVETGLFLFFTSKVVFQEMIAEKHKRGAHQAPKRKSSRRENKISEWRCALIISVPL